MEQIVQTANHLIALICSYAAFILIYGTIFAFLIYGIVAIVRTVYKMVQPTIMKWVQHIRRKKQ